MSNLIQIEMTLDEARETDRLIKRHINTTRYLLLDIRDRNGWKALGYESFGQLRPLAQVPESERKAIWDEATRKAEEEQAKLTARLVEEAVAEWKRRAHEFGDESNERRKKIRELETQVDLLKAAEPEVRVIEKPVVPADYETTKAQAKKLKTDIADLKKKQADLVQQQVTAKLRKREKEIAILDRQAKQAEALLKSLNQQIDRYTSIERMTRLQRDLIEKTRSALVDLASHLESLTPLDNDPDTDRLWDALADMLHNGALAIEQFRGRAKPALTVIRGSAT